MAPVAIVRDSSKFRPGLEFERYMAVACSLTLMIMLVVGAAGYASIRGLSWAAARTASDLRVEDRNREADPDRVATPAAIALGLIAALLLVSAATPARIKTAGASPLATSGRDASARRSTRRGD